MITAEDVLIKKGVLLKTIEESGNFPLNLTRDAHIGSAKKIKQAMIEFAEFHVQEALKEAKEKAINENMIYNCDDHTPYWGACQSCGRYDNFSRLTSNPEDIQESILNAYPLENIK